MRLKKKDEENMTLTLILTAIGFAFSLAMDAFSISLANGLNEPKMKLPRACGIAAIFGIFQGVMPMIGWILVTTVLQYFKMITPYIPYVAMIVLSFIGVKMIIEGAKHKCGDEEVSGKLTFGMLIVQGIATSIDALSTGLAMPDYNLMQAALTAIIIAGLTFVICLVGIKIGNIVGCRFAGKASIFGGVILLVIGFEILITSFFA
jgi:putative Mn2+ efflux pump MntP